MGVRHVVWREQALVELVDIAAEVVRAKSVIMADIFRCPAWRAAAQQAKWLLPAFLELRGCLFEKKKKKEVHIQKSVLQSADAVFFREVLSCCFKGSVEAGRQSLIIIQTSRKKVRSKSAYIVMAPEDLRRKIKKAGRPPGTRDTVPTVHG
ncbi:hypothetical protein AK812_SmicGene41200 [Symbiodinium microadriaticum]|uniref:Uncharacterized protein n=1 Tax=Symbiodinium microadriaticum TaxID=2951 RepID=A0A1Q9C6R3_SYMMI|nr:hypothetical protein AK812_SmicGene41200 [Symbiodinium microadriaticum]